LYDFDEVVDRRDTASEKWEKYRGRDIIPMWVADMDFRSPPVVLEALHRRTDHGVFGYTGASPQLGEAVMQILEQDYGWGIDPQWIVWLPGLVTGLNVTCRAVGSEGDEVLTLVPVYPPFLSAPRYSRRGVVRVRLHEAANCWSIDFERLAAAATPKTRLFMLCNPHNPVGRVFERHELERIAELCLSHDIVICADEIHCGLVLDPGKRHIPMATLSPEVQQHTITLMAPSKTFNLAGLGCSFAIIPSEIMRRRFLEAKAGIVPMVNPYGYLAALTAYTHGEPWRQELIDYLRRNRDLLASSLPQMAGGLSMAPVEGTYLAWIDHRRAALADPVGFFEEAGVGLQDGRDFDGPGFVRLNFGCRQALLRQAIERMSIALRKHASA
jgi:cystathionine beta-lyase